MENKHIFLMFRIQLEDNYLKTINIQKNNKEKNNILLTIGKMQKLNKEDKEYYINYIKNIFNSKIDGYNSISIKSIIFSYGIRDGLAPIKNNKENIKYQAYYNKNLPITLNPEEYGKILKKINNIYYIRVSTKTNIILIQTFTEQDGIKKRINKVEYFRNDTLVLEWIDKETNIEIPNTFTREIGATTYYYNNSKLELKKIFKKTGVFKKAKKDKKIINNFITMDLETQLIDNIHTPYLLSWYNGLISKSYYITDYKDFGNLLKNVLDDLVEFNNYTVYFHNFAKFDSYFLLKYLVELGNIDPIIHNSKLISLTFTYNYQENKILKLKFNDSYLLLPSSLKNLSKSFNINNPKGIFPFGLNNLNYKGQVPNFKYFNNISQEEYNKYQNLFKNKIWSFKEESIKYCQLDCISLYQILIKFNKLIFDKFKLNIINYPTTPSLAFKIYRSQFLPKDLINMLTGDIEIDIRKSYTGGAVDMYLPTNNQEDKIYTYDVNSLYPFVMKTYDMPIGNPTYFEGNILKYEPNAFGFFNCKIEAPNNLEHPIIQTHLKTKNGIRTVAPLGTWSGMLFSEELKNAIKFGYKFNIIDGYLFKKQNIFKDYINILYKMRLDYPKSDPMNYIAKLLLNSLYGRFGMNNNFMINEVYHENDIIKNKILEKTNNIQNIIELGEYNIIQSQNDNLDNRLDNGSITHNINIAIASAITAYARIHMSQFKNNPNYKLYYSDTDSIYINKPLDNSLISNKTLGAMKLESINTKAIFIAPKVYGLENENGEILIKAKGLTKEILNKLTLKDLESLLIKNSFKKYNQNKWFKNIAEGNIIIKDILFTLQITDNKRQLIYKNNILINLV